MPVMQGILGKLGGSDTFCEKDWLDFQSMLGSLGQQIGQGWPCSLDRIGRLGQKGGLGLQGE